jgi:hypothetical protein
MTDETSIYREARGDTKTLALELSESMKCWLDCPDFVDGRIRIGLEESETTVSPSLVTLVERARDKAMKLQEDVLQTMNYESAGLTYQEVNMRLTGKRDSRFSEQPFVAAEDLSVLYRALGELWKFINEATWLIAHPDEIEF